jgi:hypothetical protein
MYRNVTELNENELQELRSNLYHQLLDDGSLNEVMGKEIDSEDDITMDCVKDYYVGTSFVEEDFFCNLTE